MRLVNLYSVCTPDKVTSSRISSLLLNKLSCIVSGASSVVMFVWDHVKVFSNGVKLNMMLLGTAGGTILDECKQL